MNDTSVEVKEKYRRMLLERSGAERMMMGSDMADAARAMILASIPPAAKKERIRTLLFLRFYANDFSSAERDRIIRHLNDSRRLQG